MSPSASPPAGSDLALLESAVAAEPGSRLFIRLAQAYLQDGRLVEANQTLQRGLLLQPDLVEARQLLAQVLRAQGDHREALAQLQRAAAQLSRHASLYQDLAQLLAGQGREQEAQTAQRLAQELAQPPAGGAVDAGQDSQDTATMAEIYADQGLPGKAAAIYRRLLILDPGNRGYAQRLSQLEAPPESASLLGPEFLVRLEALRSAALARAGGAEQTHSALLERLGALRDAALSRADGHRAAQTGLLASLQGLRQAALTRADAEQDQQADLLHRLQDLRQSALDRAARV